MYVDRFLQGRITEAMNHSPVVVLHGPRSVGKTALVRRLREQGHLATLVSLTDASTLHVAQQDLQGWLRALPQPFAIDEAQLLPELPLALKNYLDDAGDELQVLLTGSAQIGRTGFGGSDPLAGRTRTFVLPPLTEAELHGAGGEWSVIDQLFEGKPVVGHRADDAFWWHDAVLYGGLPRTRLRQSGPEHLHEQAGEAIDAILTDDVLPDERFDAGNARRVLDYVLRHPAAELKVSMIGREIGLDPRTVDRYLDVLVRRFLFVELRNLRPPAKKTPRTSAKGFPADLAFAALANDVTDVGQQPDTVRGGLFEAFVMQQLRAHSGWSQTRTSLWHWRHVQHGRSHEVDLVLEDRSGGLVGIEVKSTSSVRTDAFKGLRAMKEHYGSRFRRGFVVTSNAAATPLSEDLWTIPADTLRTRAAWT